MLAYLLGIFLLLVPVGIILGCLKINFMLITRAIEWFRLNRRSWLSWILTGFNLFLAIVYSYMIIHAYKHQVHSSDWSFSDLDELGAWFQWMVLESIHAGVVLLSITHKINKTDITKETTADSKQTPQKDTSN